MHWEYSVIALLLAVIFIGLPLARRLRDRLTEGPTGTLYVNLIWRVLRVYCRLMHRPTYVSAKLVPPGNKSGPLIVVCNHTAGIDPLLITAFCHFEIRWMMARDSMTPAMDWLWRAGNVIPVDRDGADVAPAREAIRHVREGGAVGIFPEGGIARPSGSIRPFMDGVGLIVSRTRAPVLLVWVSQTPDVEHAFDSLYRRSRSRIEFVDLMDFSGSGLKAAGITRALRERLAEASGWPLHDEIVPTARQGETNAEPDPFAP